MQYAISTHAPAGGATEIAILARMLMMRFLLTPLREGRLSVLQRSNIRYRQFLLTPLREGRQENCKGSIRLFSYFYSRPCGRGDIPG